MELSDSNSLRVLSDLGAMTMNSVVAELVMLVV